MVGDTDRTGVTRPGLSERGGTLYLVATPIGNLEEITRRALRVLGEVQVIAAEDTRRARRLLAHFGLTTSVVSLFEHNERARVPQLLGRLAAGENVAVVTDAGSPGISDPGYPLTRAAAAAGVRVESVPGPSAVIAALQISGLPTDAFVFAGFLPPKGAARPVSLWKRARAGSPKPKPRPTPNCVPGEKGRVSG